MIGILSAADHSNDNLTNTHARFGHSLGPWAIFGVTQAETQIADVFLSIGTPPRLTFSSGSQTTRPSVLELTSNKNAGRLGVTLFCNLNGNVLNPLNDM